MDLLAELKLVEEFKPVPENQLQWLIDHCSCMSLEVGEFLFRPGTPIDSLFVVLKGQFIIKVTQNGQHRVISKIEKHDISGLLPYSRADKASGYAEAVKPAAVLVLYKDHFTEMIRNKHELTTVLVHNMSSRIRRFTKLEQQNDKIMALGKLSAGLAHELNNPSAAVVRSSRALAKHLRFLPEKFKSVIKIKATDEQVDLVNDIIFSKVGKEPIDMSLIERSEKEDELLDWLDEHGVEDADEIAENLVDFVIEMEDLEKIRALVLEKDISPIMNWLNQVLTTEKLVSEIEEASQRINNLVSSIKSYTHMDQAPVKTPTDIHKGINNTLTMLNHKVKKAGIDVVKKFDQDIPHPEVLISEMNQVWTNLIDNAIDAMEASDERKLTLETIKDGRYVSVIISDTGSGIPIEIKDKIFDPFFTTKAVGKGTGMGLEMVQQIIKNQHNGVIYVDSVPKETTFRVCIPIKAS
ncbi:MAG: ATP-binding protein [Bacteroidota bacterium]